MNDLMGALIATGGTVLGAAVSGVVTYKTALIGFKRKQSQTQLLQALEDLQFMGELEKLWLERAASGSDKSSEALKREFRASVRETMGHSLSEGAEPARLRKAIDNIKKEI